MPYFMIACRMKPQVIYNPFAIANYHNHQNAIIHQKALTENRFILCVLALLMLRILLFLYSFKSLYTFWVLFFGRDDRT